MPARQDCRHHRDLRLNSSAESTAALEPAIRVETPEGIELELQPAGLQARGCAWLLDLLIRGSVVYVVTIVAGLLGGLGMGLFLIMLFLVEWFYPVVFELSPLAATPGKRIVGLRVVMSNGLPITMAASFSRNLLRAADFLPVAYAAGAACMLLRSDFRRLGDLVADTMVIHVRQPVVNALPAGVEPVPPFHPINLEAQSALMRLATRASRINSERLDEVAALAAPACSPLVQPGAALTRNVLGVGYWLLGGRRA
jgi:uncharacterized RDD family membrane protein YckC